MISALPLTDKVTYHNLLEELVCSTESELCMIHRYQNCPGTSALQRYIESKLEKSMLENDESVKFKQWISTDQVTIEEQIKPLSDFLDILIQETDTLTTHHYIAKNQSNYLKHQKPNEAIIKLYFAENYSFVIQDAIQGYHWNNSQATLHPFVVYYREDEGQLAISTFVSLAIALTVHSFIDVVLQYLTSQTCEIFSKVLVYYFSDGAISQYKNYKNMCNLVNHHDFKL